MPSIMTLSILMTYPNDTCLSNASPNKSLDAERRERVSHHNWFGDAFVNSRRRVNSNVRRPTTMTNAPIDVFAGVAGIPLSVDSFDLGEGIIVERMFAHLMAPFMLAFAPASQGKPHPTP